MHAKTSKKKIFLYMIVSIFLTGFLIPQNLKMPVDGASKSSYNQQSFWYYPWGKSGTHKGVDIFAKEGTAIKSATNGIVVFTRSVRIRWKCNCSAWSQMAVSLLCASAGNKY
jgi:hypothetical protein